MTTEAELVRAVAADLDDAAAWQVYLDWLLEREDPRAELVRLQMAREDADEEEARLLDKQIDALLDAHGKAWLAAVPALPGVKWGMARGVVGQVTGSAAKLASQAEAILAHAPLLTVLRLWFEVGDPSKEMSPLEGSPLLARARKLWIDSSGHRIWRWSGLQLPELRSLVLTNVALAREDVEAIVTAMPKLESLQISRCRFNKGAFEAFAGLRCPLRRIVLAATHAGPPLVDLLARFPDLTNVQIPANEIGSAACQRLAPLLANATYLDLRANELDVSDLPALLREDSKLVMLALGGNDLGDEGAEAISAWPGARNLTTLDLWTNSIGDRGATALASSTQLSTKLVLLKLGRLSATAKEALLAAPQLANARIFAAGSMLGRKAREAALAKAARAAAKASKPK